MIGLLLHALIYLHESLCLVFNFQAMLSRLKIFCGVILNYLIGMV